MSISNFCGVVKALPLQISVNNDWQDPFANADPFNPFADGNGFQLPPFPDIPGFSMPTFPPMVDGPVGPFGALPPMVGTPGQFEPMVGTPGPFGPMAGTPGPFGPIAAIPDPVGYYTTTPGQAIESEEGSAEAFVAQPREGSGYFVPEVKQSMA